MKTIELKNLQRLSSSWDERTVKVAVHMKGSSNMFGGSGKIIMGTLHGNNSIEATGTFTPEGEINFAYNIARGGNGKTSSIATYAINGEEINKLELSGACNAGDALIYALDYLKDWYVE